MFQDGVEEARVRETESLLAITQNRLYCMFSSCEMEQKRGMHDDVSALPCSGEACELAGVARERQVRPKSARIRKY